VTLAFEWPAILLTRTASSPRPTIRWDMKVRRKSWVVTLLHDRAAVDGFLLLKNPITPAGRAVDIALELWAVIVVAGAARAIAAFIQNADSK
jgi:hypothetical protein